MDGDQVHVPQLDLGACVRLCVATDAGTLHVTGVVTDIAPPGCLVTTFHHFPVRRARDTRYWIQGRDGCCLARAEDLEVIAW